jgi:hypothetical protein
MKSKVFIVHYDSRNGPLFSACATMKGAKKYAQKWIDELGGISDTEWAKHEKLSWFHEGYGEYMNIVKLTVNE